MNKKILGMPIALFIVLGIGMVLAIGLVISTLTLRVDVQEPFDVEYAILGDAGDYNPSEDGYCSDGGVSWSTSTEVVETGGMYPAESRKLCAQIQNAGESPITYSITSKIKTGEGNYEDCVKAFPETSIYGVVPGESTITNGKAFTIPGNAPEVENCIVTIEVARGVEGPVSETAYFTQKNLVDWVPYGTTAEITYTVIGDSFDVSGIPSGYTLIYYPNTVGDVFATNVANVIVLQEGSNNIPSLPLEIDVGDNYCGNGDNPTAETCNGAKLWLIPGDGSKLSSWTNPETYLFETDLITYTKTA